MPPFRPAWAANPRLPPPNPLRARAGDVLGWVHAVTGAAGHSAPGAENVGDDVLKDQRSLSEKEWLARMERLGRREGFFTRLGDRHSALFADRETTLIVTFETVEAIRRRQPDEVPLGFSVCETRDWSHLCLIADGDTWYRDQAVYDFFDGLVDDAFFDGYEQVIFFGAGMAGYAAAAFSVAAPGATVILVQPQATLDPSIAGWDTRFAEHRRLNFTDRYGYAPDMTDGAAQVFLIYDPGQTFDAMHAALFRRPQTTYLPCRGMGPDLGSTLLATHILPSVLSAAADGAFDAAMFRTFCRARRNHVPYLRRLINRLDAAGRTRLAEMVAGNAAGRLNDERFRARADDLASRTGGQPAHVTRDPA